MDTSSVFPPKAGPYENYIHNLLSQWPHLRVVTDFMFADLESSSRSAQAMNRVFKTDIRVIDIINTYTYNKTTVKDQHFDDIKKFQNFLEEPRKTFQQNITRFIMVEDLSAKVIETLGSKYSVDPEFFAQHLGDWWLEYRTSMHKPIEGAGYAPSLLNSSIRKQGFQHFTFQRAYEVLEADLVEKSNSLRPSISERDMSGRFANERFSAISLMEGFSGNYAVPDEYWTGIYLFDPILGPAPRLYGGVRNFRRKPVFSLRTPPPPHWQYHVTTPVIAPAQKPDRSSAKPDYSYKPLRNEFADYILKMSEAELKLLHDRRNFHVPMELPLRVLLSSWVLVADILNRRMESAEEDGSRLADLIIDLRKYARHFCEDLERTLFNLRTYLENAKYSMELQADTQQLISRFSKIQRLDNYNVLC